MGSFFGRRICAAVALATVALASFTAVSCGPGEVAPTPKISSSPAPVTDDVFESQTSDVIEMADRSAGQVCELVATSPLLVSPPDNARQRQLFADALVAWTAAAAPNLDPADSSVLQESAVLLRDSSDDVAGTDAVDLDRADTDARAAVERFIAANEAACSPAASAPAETLPTAP